jgi:hypothetical protein
LKVNIRNIAGNWDKGVALDKHTVRSIPKGSNESGHMQFDTIRSEVGEALYQLNRHFQSNLQTQHEYTKSHHFSKSCFLQSLDTSDFDALAAF